MHFHVYKKLSIVWSLDLIALFCFSVVKLNDTYAHTVQFRLKFDFALFIYHSLNFYIFLEVIFPLTSMVTLPEICLKKTCNSFKPWPV